MVRIMSILPYNFHWHTKLEKRICVNVNDLPMHLLFFYEGMRGSPRRTLALLSWGTYFRKV